LAKKSGLIIFKERAIQVMPEIKILKAQDELCSLKQDWNVLHSKSKSNSPFSTWEWVSSYEKILMGRNEKLNIICVYNEGRKLIAVAPFVMIKERRYGLDFDIIELIGSDGRIAADYMDIIIDPEHLDEGKKLLANYLTGGADFKWDAIRWSGILDDSKCWDLTRQFKNAGYETAGEAMDICPYITLPKTWEEYLNTLSKKSRYNVRKKRRDLEKEHRNNLFSIVDDEDSLLKTMEWMCQLHRQRMTMKGIKGYSTSSEFWKFQKEVAREFLAKGWLFLGVLEVDGSPVALQYGFKFNNKLFHYQTGFDPNYERHSAGLISTGYMIENALKEKLQEYDFLRGREDYKFHWTQNVRTIYFSLITNKNFGGRFYFRAGKTLKRLKTGLKVLLGRHTEIE
jgi:CelD/BcsL family acetyltransferase involved in cellulose biosynthesis